MEKACLNEAFGILGKRWNGLIIHALLECPLRFSDIAWEIPDISSRMLAQRLKELEQENMLTRTVYPETPVKILYSLTPKGRDLADSILAIQKWADNWCCKDKED